MKFSFTLIFISLLGVLILLSVAYFFIRVMINTTRHAKIKKYLEDTKSDIEDTK